MIFNFYKLLTMLKIQLEIITQKLKFNLIKQIKRIKQIFLKIMLIHKIHQWIVLKIILIVIYQTVIFQLIYLIFQLTYLIFQLTYQMFQQYLILQI
jgi:hypothetical protein